MVKRRPVLVALLTSFFFASSVLAGDVDPRFDGIWVGREMFAFGAPGIVNIRVHTTYTTEFGIANHGKTIAFTQGWKAGRYEVVPEKSGGNKLVFQMPGTNGDKLLFLGRQHCTLRLSADGNTIKEQGFAILSIDRNGRGTRGSMWGTFHREGILRQR
jgi:hypothetical protein